MEAIFLHLPFVRFEKCLKTVIKMDMELKTDEPVQARQILKVSSLGAIDMANIRTHNWQVSLAVLGK